MKLETKKEAVRRMKMLQLLNDKYGPIADFIYNDEVWKSEFRGILYFLDEDEKKAVQEVENKYKKYDLKVYHCYKAHTEFDEILYMFFVSNDDTPSRFDRDLKHNIAYIYAYNMSEPAFSEFGSVYVQSLNGGIVVR